MPDVFIVMSIAAILTLVVLLAKPDTKFFK